MSRAVSNILATQIRSDRVTPVEVRAMRDAAAARVSESVHGYIERVHDKLRVVATVQDTASHKTTRTEVAEGPVDRGLLPLIDAVARKIAPDVHPYASRSEEAVRLFFQAVNAREKDRLKPLERAVELDPAFGPAWLLRAETLLALKDQAAAKAVLDQAAQHASNFRDIDRARLDLLRAGDPDRRAAAMEQIAKASADIDVWRQLAELHMIRKQYGLAIKAYEAALEIEPGNIALLNQLGYTHAFAGDLPAAIKALERYRAAAPGDANALDSLGEVHFLMGKFGDAERYFQEAHAKNPSALNGGELFRAALARGLAGDKTGARQLYAKYAGARQQEPFATIREAIFLLMIGEQKIAEEKLATSQDAAARAQLALVHASRHDLAKALEIARASAASAKTPPEKTLIALALAMAADNVANMPKNLAAYRLLFRKSPQAEAAWREFYDALSGTAASDARVMLAWAMKMNGKDPGDLMKLYPLPPQHPEAGFGFLTISKFVEMKR